MAERTVPFPKEFTALMEQLLGSESGAFFDAMHAPPVRGIRLRDSKRFFPEADCLSPIPWSDDAWVLDTASALGRHPLHSAGAFYLQEPSAMVPAAALAPRDGARVLDLCAAPGGKSVQLARMNPNGLLVANEINPGRARTLSANIERMGIANCMVTSMAPDKLAVGFPETFDAVLVDAPCSGEGMFRKNPLARTMWSPAHAAGSAKRQQAILADAARMVKPGGRLVYSTCTFNRTENEDVVDAFLLRHTDFLPLPFALPGLPAAPDGRLKLWPHLHQGEGQFTALMQRAGQSGEIPKPKPDAARADAFLREAQALLRDIVKDDLMSNARLGGVAVVLPPLPLPVDGVPVLRLGLHAAAMSGKELRPDHALAMSAQARQQVPVDMEQAQRYLAGETLAVPNPLRGWATPVLSGFSLGWGKASHGVLKNHLPKGLRTGARRSAEE